MVELFQSCVICLAIMFCEQTIGKHISESHSTDYFFKKKPARGVRWAARGEWWLTIGKRRSRQQEFRRRNNMKIIYCCCFRYRRCVKHVFLSESRAAPPTRHHGNGLLVVGVRLPSRKRFDCASNGSKMPTRSSNSATEPTHKHARV